ncbi:carboxypeptidase-like regulatory domain-containing protein [Nocardioides dilutus]
MVRVHVALLTVIALLLAGHHPEPARADPARIDTAWTDTVPAADQAQVVRSATVRLVSGELLRVLTRADGSVVSTLLAGSSHARGALVRWRAGADTFVLPQMPRSMLRKLDLSLFDVTRLETYGDRVPVTVRFEADAVVHRLPGLRLDRTSLRATSRARVVQGSYGRGFPGLSADDLAGVASIRLADPGRRAPGRTAQDDAATHRVTVTVRDRKGDPVPGAVVTVSNVADGSIYQDVTGDQGEARFDVPQGPYSAIGFTFRRLVMAPEFDVASDLGLALDTSAATVKPHVSLPGHRVVDSALSLTRTPDSGFGIPFSFSGPRFFMRVQPAPADVAHGALGTGVSATLAPKGTGGEPYDRLAITADVAQGVPDSLTFEHRRRDFSTVVQWLYANGPPGLRQSFFGAFGRIPNGFIDMFTGHEFAVQVPGRRVVLFQAGDDSSYQQTVMPLATPADGDDLSQLIAVGRFPRAGTVRRIDFAHGPVGPGYRGGAARAADVIRREKGRLVGNVPLFDSSGAALIGVADRQNAEWSLRSGHDLLARGRGDARLRVPVPKGQRAYVLTATSRPDSSSWTLSTLVRDEWTFRFGGERIAAPLLSPQYAPPVSLSGAMPAGPTSFRLAFRSLTEADLPITSARMQWSTDDGRSWRDARLTRLSRTSFRVAYDNPRAGAGRRFVSFRIVASDGQGDRVVETAMRVYRLG